METETSGADQKDPNEKEEDRSNMAGNQRDASKSTERERDASLDPRKVISMYTNCMNLQLVISY